MPKRINPFKASDDEQLLLDAGFTTNSAGPTNWRCSAERAGWSTKEYEGFPLRWDLVTAEAKEKFPELFK